MHSSSKGHMKYAKNMRVFHNKIKNRLIERAVRAGTKNPSLLDIGVGRGGDMFKWNLNGVQDVYGYDPNPAYVQEANNRYNDSHLLNRNYVFSTKLCDSGPFDIVSCQFAVHYMFESERALTEHLRYVNGMLKPNGYYVGTFMNGDLVRRLVNDNGHFTNQAIRLRLSEPGGTVNFAAPLDVHLAGTLYFGEKSVSSEYLVLPDVLEQKCKEQGLILVEYRPFEKYNDEFRFNLGSDFSACSYLYCSFVFIKKT